MAGASKPLSWLPGVLVAAGLYFLAAGWLSGGPDRVGGIVFAVVSFAAAAAILHRRARDARAAPPNGEAAQPGTVPEGHSRDP